MKVQSVFAGTLMLAAIVPVGAQASPDGRIPEARAAGVMWEIAAADEVQRVAGHRYPKFTWVATCRSVAQKRFTCEVAGYKGSTFANGRSNVKKVNRYKYKVTSLQVNFT